MSAAVQIVVIVAAGAVVGVVANSASPRPASLFEPVHAAAELGAGSCSQQGGPAEAPAPRIAVDEAKALCDGCRAAFVDARGPAAFAAGHVTGAVHLPPAASGSDEAAVTTLRAFPLVVVYDGDYSCALADEVAARLRRAGVAQVRVLEGAWPAWVAGGGSGTSGECPVCGDDEGHR